MLILPSLFLSHLSLFLSLEVRPLSAVQGSGERCTPQRKSNFVHLTLNADIWWHQIYSFIWEAIDRSVSRVRV